MGAVRQHDRQHPPASEPVERWGVAQPGRPRDELRRRRAACPHHRLSVPVRSAHPAPPDQVKVPEATAPAHMQRQRAEIDPTWLTTSATRSARPSPSHLCQVTAGKPRTDERTRAAHHVTRAELPRQQSRTAHPTGGPDPCTRCARCTRPAVEIPAPNQLSEPAHPVNAPGHRRARPDRRCPTHVAPPRRDEHQDRSR